MKQLAPELIFTVGDFLGLTLEECMEQLPRTVVRKLDRFLEGCPGVFEHAAPGTWRWVRDVAAFPPYVEHALAYSGLTIGAGVPVLPWTNQPNRQGKVRSCTRPITPRAARCCRCTASATQCPRCGRLSGGCGRCLLRTFRHPATHWFPCFLTVPWLLNHRAYLAGGGAGAGATTGMLVLHRVGTMRARG